MVATLNGNPSATIISCYWPTEETDLYTFNNELPSFVHSIPKHNVLIVGGDMNDQIGKNENNKLSLHILTKQKWGTPDFTLENVLTGLNTKFQKKKGKTTDIHLRK